MVLLRRFGLCELLYPAKFSLHFWSGKSLSLMITALKNYGEMILRAHFLSRYEQYEQFFILAKKSTCILMKVLLSLLNV